jgi:MaoC like domain
MADERSFTWDDQRRFAQLSGDWNPMHMDPEVARRTLAGACVVHGLQSLLWMLERAGEFLPLANTLQLDANFMQFLYLEESVRIAITGATNTQAGLDLRCGDRLISRCRVTFGRRPTEEPPLVFTTENPPTFPADINSPREHAWTELASLEGYVRFGAISAAGADAYPRLCAAFTAPRVTAILAVTRLVGMVSPGLHSTFHRLAITLVDEPHDDDRLRFSPVNADPRFQLLNLAVRAPGLAGTVTASRRKPPVPQPGCAELHAPTAQREFSGHTALVVGGSRGLGELTAKLLALRGVNALVTYLSGRTDAEAVVADIRNAARRATALPLDVLAPLAPQLSALPGPPTSMYFFATCRIAGHATAGYSAARYQLFNRLYVDAFHALCTTLAQTFGPIEVFYPSSAFVGEATAGMVDYAMAKAAGEVLAADLNRFHPGISVEVARLPRLPTDQTNSIAVQELESAVSWLRPLVERIETRVAERCR